MRNHREVEPTQVDAGGLRVRREGLGIVAGIEQDALAAILDERRETPVLLKSGGTAESVIQNGDAVAGRRARERHGKYQERDQQHAP